ncbi:haloacid dehalogenase-like hydrolase [Dyella choica]|uniref:Haloacid dehalogenase-like hydrolase n=1 Tax=Dyella choica TaxID=1927959 RepID=A0A3S0S9F6_9GAMM|nr:haloacid dehalogenase-like hydrolase [Dyella choica]RUL74471.1 haloacid dehalogenase-like hydrolase [Dyella choica]
MFTGEKIHAPAQAGSDADASRTVLFDFDGVLFQGDAFQLFIRHRYASSLMYRMLAMLCMPWWLLCGVFSQRLASRTLIHVALCGLGTQRYQVAAEAFADQLVRQPRQFYRDGLSVLRRHLAEGDQVIVVTGCERILVARLLSQLGLPELRIVASQLKPGLFGMRVHMHNVGRRKVQNLATQGVTNWRLAYSDSFQDMPMLKQAAEAVLVNGTPKLCKRVEKALGRAVTRVAWY